MLRIMVVLYGDVYFDGRVKRIIDIAQTMGKVCLIDASSLPISISNNFEHHRVCLHKGSSVVRRHTKFWRCVVSAANVFKPDLIFAEDFFTIFPGYLASIITGSKLIYDAHELIVPEAGQQMSMRNKFWYNLERIIVPYADLIIAANPERAKIMAKHYRLRRAPTYMRNIPIHKEVTIAKREEILKIYSQLQRSNDDERILLYQGDVSLSRGLARFVDVLNYLPPSYRLIVAGDGPDLKRLKTIAEPHIKTGRCLLLGKVPNDILPAVTVHCDIGIVTYPYNRLNNIYCAPNKIFEYMQAGLPVIASDQPPLKNLLQGVRSSQLFSKNSTAINLAKQILQIDTHRETLTDDIKNLLKKYNFEVEFIRTIEAINKVLS